VLAKFASLGFDLPSVCASGVIGTPTWNPTENDLAGRFSSSGTHEILDYLILHSSSEEAATSPSNDVRTLKSDNPWTGTFCSSSTLGTLGDTDVGRANALTDHSVVIAKFSLPNGDSALPEAATAVFDAVVAKWSTSSGAQEAACGQTGAVCGFDTNCCEAEHSWTGVEQHCDAFECKACAGLGESCGPQLEGSACCGYNDYTTGKGMHCEWGKCARKFGTGVTCAWDEECQSRRCEWHWDWFSSGLKCL